MNTSPQSPGQLCISPLHIRQKIKNEGGIFKNWMAVVIMDDLRYQETYRMILELGGAKVARWTVKHLSDLDVSEMKSITHVISHPNMLLNENFQEFLRKNKNTSMIPVLAYIFVGDFLTKSSTSMDMYDIRKIHMIELLASKEHKDDLRKFSSPALSSTSRDIPVPLFVPDADSDLQFSQPDPNDVESLDIEDTPDRVDDDFIQTQTMSTPKSLTRKRSATKELFAETEKKLRNCNNRTEEVEMIDTVDAETEKRNNNISKLKSLAQSFMKKAEGASKSPGPSRANSNQSKIDSWVSKSPRKMPAVMKSEEDDIMILEDSQSGSRSQTTQVNRRQRSSQQQIETDSFLSQTRSGSIKRSQSARSQNFFSQSSSQDSNTQDSFISDTGSDCSQLNQPFDINMIDKDPNKQKLWLITLMTAQRRIETHRLDVGSGSVPLKFPQSSETPSQLSPSMCQNMWNCLESLEDQLDLEREIDLGWINACEYMVRAVNDDVFLPSAAMHKIMMDAIKNHKDREIRGIAFNSLMHCVNYHPPGPGNQGLTQLFRDSYLEIFSKATPYVGKWEFNAMDPWNFLQTTIENCIDNCVLYNSNDSGGDNLSDISGDGDESKSKLFADTMGYSLLLKLFTEICETDMNNWFTHITEQDNIDFADYKPFLACVLCPKDNVGWSKQYQILVNLYVKAISMNSHETDLVNVRKLVGLSAQILQLRDRAEKNNRNKLKLEMSKSLAFQLTSINLSEQRLWCELYLLEPAWLSSLVSRAMLGITTNTDIKEAVSLRSTITRFVDTEIRTAVIKEDPDNKAGPSMVTSTPMSTKTMNNNVPMSSMSPVKSSPLRPLPTKSTKTKSSKINVNKQNKYGETPLHLAAKKGNGSRMEDCLNTPGVDINCACYNGFTPLAEAVHHNHPNIVSMLLNFTPKSLPINNYFTPTKGNVPIPRRKLRVDILKQNNENMQNPFHEAVENDNVEIAKLFLDTLALEEAKPDSGLPSVSTLLSTNTGKGDTPISFAGSDQMKALLQSYSNRIVKKENKENASALVANTGSSGITIKDPLTFKVLVEINMVKYINSNSISHVYSLFKSCKLEDLLNAVEFCEPPKTIDKWGKIEFRGEEFNPTLFGKKKERFDIYRDKTVIAQDLRDYEKLKHFEKEMKNVGPSHPLCALLRKLKITKM